MCFVLILYACDLMIVSTVHDLLNSLIESFLIKRGEGVVAIC